MKSDTEAYRNGLLGDPDGGSQPHPGLLVDVGHLLEDCLHVHALRVSEDGARLLQHPARPRSVEEASRTRLALRRRVHRTPGGRGRGRDHT